MEDDGCKPPIDEITNTLETIFRNSQSNKEPFPDSRKLAAFYVLNHQLDILYKSKRFANCDFYMTWMDQDE